MHRLFLIFLGSLASAFPHGLQARNLELQWNVVANCGDQLARVAALPTNNFYRYIRGDEPHQKIVRYMLGETRAGRALVRRLIGRNPKIETDMDRFVLEMNERGYSDQVLKSMRTALLQIGELRTEPQFRLLFDLGLESLAALHLAYRPSLLGLGPPKLVRINSPDLLSWPLPVTEDEIYQFENGKRLVLLHYPFLIDFEGYIRPHHRTELRLISDSGESVLISKDPGVIATIFRNGFVKRYIDEVDGSVVYFGLKPELLSDLVYKRDFSRMKALIPGIDFDFLAVSPDGSLQLACSNAPRGSGAFQGNITILGNHPIRFRFTYSNHSILVR